MEKVFKLLLFLETPSLLSSPFSALVSQKLNLTANILHWGNEYLKSHNFIYVPQLVPDKLYVSVVNVTRVPGSDFSIRGCSAKQTAAVLVCKQILMDSAGKCV